MSILPGTKAPWFSSVGFQDGNFLDISLSDFSADGKWIVLFFYPLDFGYITPSELMELESKRLVLEKMECKILAVSSDSILTHEQFASISPAFGGVHGIKFPLLEDKNSNISKMYGVNKEGAGHSFRAYFVIDSDEVVRARILGDLPVGLGMGEMVRQVKSLKLAVTSGVCVDGEGNSLGECSLKIEHSDEGKKTGLAMFQSDASYYNNYIIHNADMNAEYIKQSPVNIVTKAVVQEDTLGPITFKYTSVWSKSVVETPDTPQPTVVTNVGKTWQVKIPNHLQLMIYGGPLESKNYRLVELHAHWGGSEHLLDGQQMDGELHLVHYHIKYKDSKEAIMHEDGLAVVSIMLKIHPTESNEELDKIGEVLPQIKLKGQAAQTAEHVDLENILPMDKDYYTYSGSLTTPGFQECVTWVVLKEPVMVSKKLIDRMKELRFGGENSNKMMVNCRKTAPLGDRVVLRPSAK